MSERNTTLVIERPEDLWRGRSRREFLRVLGVGGTVVLLPSAFAACDDDDDPVNPGGTAVTLDLRTDTGILNYAYALEQLEAAFYVAVLASTSFNGMTTEEKEVLTDLRNHEVVHRQFFAQVLGTAKIRDLALDATTVTTATSSAVNILKTAETFEDLGVAAYNGAGKYLTSAANLLVAGKIVSVEARHAAAIRDIRDARGGLAGTPANTRFAGDDITDANGRDVVLEPASVLSRVIASGFVTTSVTISNPPVAETGSGEFGPPNPTP